MSKTFVIAGIGTEVGKTVTSAVLCEAWKTDYWKPVQAGGLEFTDTDLVKSLVSNTSGKFHTEGYCLTEPMSPHAAAEIDNVVIDESGLKIPVTENNLLIELAGGLMVPLRKDFLNIDLIKFWKLPVILVSRNYLGSINHTLLSLDVLKKNNISVEGIIFNGDEVKATEDVILQYAGVRRIGRVPGMKLINKESVRIASENFPKLL